MVPFEYSAASALIVVDVQNDFADPAGSLAVRGGDDVIDFINDQIGQAEAAGAFVVHTQDWHPPNTPHFDKDGGIWPVHCVADSWGAEFHPELRVGWPSVKKGTGGEDGYSGFTVRDPVTEEETPTQLADMLRERSISRVAVLGLATDYCVLATAIDSVELGFETTVLADGVRSVDLAPGDGARAIATMVSVGVTVI